MRVSAAEQDPATALLISSPDNPATASPQEDEALQPGSPLADSEPCPPPPRASTMVAVGNLGILACATAAAVLVGGALGVAIHALLQGGP